MTSSFSRYLTKKYLLWFASGLFAATFINKFGSKILYHLSATISGWKIDSIGSAAILVIFFLLFMVGFNWIFGFLYPTRLMNWIKSWFGVQGNMKVENRSPISEKGNLYVSTGTGKSFLSNFLRFWLVWAGSIAIYLTSEWLFLVTKPSFMDGYRLPEKLSVLLGSFTTLVIVFIPVWTIIGIIKILFWPRTTPKIISVLSVIIPSLFLSITLLLLIDNFTYTILGFGIINSESLTRVTYTGLFLLSILSFIFRLKNYIESQYYPRFSRFPSHTLLLVFLIGLIFRIPPTNEIHVSTTPPTQSKTSTLPNIILLGSDGVNADRMSLYGYGQETTPTLDQLSDQSLVAENHFTNSGQTSGSIVSIFTGRIPYATKVVNIPDTLQNADSYLHLPQILHELGYTNTSITYTRYLDAYSLNFQDGFDRVNGRSLETDQWMRLIGKLSTDRVRYFLMTLQERMIDRINHIFFVQQMPNPFGEVYSIIEGEDREKRLNELFELIDSGKRPFFAHIHLMGTHGPRFAPEVQVFSSGIQQSKDGIQEYYDDSIHDFDRFIHEVLIHLENAGIKDNTILIIYSDHPRTRVVPKRIPLIFLFPDGQYAGKISANTQNIDIAPTILDYLDQPIPDWMDGISLLQGEPDPERPVFGSAARAKITDNPFFSFGIFSMVVCNRYVYYTARTSGWTEGEVDGMSSSCQAKGSTAYKEMKIDLIEELKKYNFDTREIQP